MPDKKISELALAAPLDGGEYIEAVQGGQNVRVRLPRPLGFNQDLLHALHTRLVGMLPFKVVGTGDSTTQSFDATLLPKIATSMRLPVCTYVNRGQPGMSTPAWVSTYVADDFAQAPHLLIVRWGLNDPFDGVGTAESCITALRTGLAWLRAQTGGDWVNLSILLCTPTATDNPSQHRGPDYHEALSIGFRKAAKDFDCAFLDLYSMFPNPRPPFYDNPNGLGPIHPLAMHNIRIAQAIADFAFRPLAAAPYLTGGSNYELRGVPSSERLVSAADLPNTFPVGSFHMRAQSGFPLNGFVRVERHFDGWPVQINTGLYGESYYHYRSASDGTTWGAWMKVGSTKVANVASPSSGFTSPANTEKMTAYTDGSPDSPVIADGYVAKTTSAQITAGMSIAQLNPPPTQNIVTCTLGCFGATMEFIRGQINQSGVVTALENSTQTNISRVYLSQCSYRRA